MPTRPAASRALSTRLCDRLDRRRDGGARRAGDVAVAAPAPSVLTLQDGQGRRAGQPLGRRSSPSPTRLPLLRRSRPQPKSNRPASGRRRQATATASASSRSPSRSGSRSSTRPTRRAATSTTSTARPRARSAWPKYGQIDFSAGAAHGPPLLGRLAGMGRQALRLRQLPARGPLRQLALQRPGCSPSTPAATAASSYVTYRVRLSRQTERGMYDLAASGR